MARGPGRSPGDLSVHPWLLLSCHLSAILGLAGPRPEIGQAPGERSSLEILGTPEVATVVRGTLVNYMVTDQVQKSLQRTFFHASNFPWFLHLQDGDKDACPGWRAVRRPFPSTCPLERVRPTGLADPASSGEKNELEDGMGAFSHLLGEKFQYFVGVVYSHFVFALFSLHPFLPITKALVLRSFLRVLKEDWKTFSKP